MIQVKDLNADGPFVIEIGRPPFTPGWPVYVESLKGVSAQFASATDAEMFLHRTYSSPDLVELRFTILPRTQMVDPAKMPPLCPTCGGKPVEIFVGMKKTKPAGMRTEHVECENGHSWEREKS